MIAPDRLWSTCRAHFNGEARVGFAVSGGGDSMAMLDLLAPMARADAVVPVAVTVDHGLRPEAAEEIALVRAFCAARGIAHHVVRWTWDGAGNLQQAARQARRDLLAQWAQDLEISSVLLAHTEDDQAETVLLRLARGSGVDGLAAMKYASDNAGVRWLRPLLGVTRAELRAHLIARDIPWADDPSNADPRFDRVRARAMLQELATLGVTPARLAQTAAHMGRAKTVLDAEARAILDHVDTVAGHLRVPWKRLAEAPEDTRTRALAWCLGYVSGRGTRPRYGALRAVIEGAPTTATLHGCVIVWRGEDVFVAREYGAITGLRADSGALWDGRWRVGDLARGQTVAPLGPDGVAQHGAWRAMQWPRAAVLGMPGLWQDGALLAAAFDAKPPLGWLVPHQSFDDLKKWTYSH